jgi:group II intron reverse transcriptase/maturase
MDDITIEAFARNKEVELRNIRDRLRRREFSFSPLRAVAIEKKRGGYRPILIPTVGDRIVQRAILHLISEPLKPHVSYSNSFAFRQGAGVRSAVAQLCQELRSGRRYVVVVDIVDFFASIDSELLYRDLEEVLPDETLTPILKRLQNWEINDLANLPMHKRRCFPEAGKGVPQGSALSPILSNFFLRAIDKGAQELGIRTIRYADDIAIPCESLAQAEEAFDWLGSQVGALGLRIHPIGSPKSRLVEVGTGSHPGIEYLGFFLRPWGLGVRVHPCKKAIDHAKNEIDECFDVASDASLAERYLRLSYFLNSWLATYGYVCPVARERQQLLDHTQRALARLLVRKGLLGSETGLTREQRRFLSIDTVFGTADIRHAVRMTMRSTRPPTVN